MKKIIGLMGCVVLSTVLLTGCGKKDDTTKENFAIERGDIVNISYTSTVKDGSNDLIEKDIQKVIEIGKDKLFNLLDKDLLGKKTNDTFKKILKGGIIYQNKFSDGNIQQIPLQIFKDSKIEVFNGQKLDLGEMKGIVKKITDEYVVVDSNPAYLDKDIVFDITITDIQKKKIEEVEINKN